MHYAIDQIQQPEAPTVRYLTDAKQSTFTVRAFATGMLSAFGHNPTITIADFEGEASVNLENLEESSLRLVIQSSSLAVADDVSEKDRNEMNRIIQQEVLDSGSYPEIVYECSKISASKTGEGQYWVAMNGDLSLRGVTHSQAVSARVSLTGDSLRAGGEFSVLQSTYQIKPVSAAGGTIKLKDELKLSFNIIARKQG